jgi:hypothetical protein
MPSGVVVTKERPIEMLNKFNKKLKPNPTNPPIITAVHESLLK